MNWVSGAFKNDHVEFKEKDLKTDAMEVAFLGAWLTLGTINQNVFWLLLH